MSDEKPADDARKLPDTKDFGIFYPVGYIVVGFSSRASAEQVQQDLMNEGYEQADCPLFTSKEIADNAKHNLAKLTGFAGFLAGLGKSDDVVQTHLDAARQGATFLLVHAPGDTDTKHAMRIIRRVPFEFAHRYRRLVIEELT